MGKLSTKIIMTGLVAIIAVWLWPTDEANDLDSEVNAAQPEPFDHAAQTNSSAPNQTVSGSLVSKIAPATAQANTAISAEAQDWASHDKGAFSALSEQDSLELLRLFEQANSKLENGQWQAAEQDYQALTEAFPNLVEPYVNLAAAQAKGGRLEDARQTLMLGASANPSTKILFESINQLHGSLAAQAYRNALETEVSNTIVTTLPKVNRLATDFVQAQQLERLSQQLEDAKNQQAALSANSAQLDALKTQFSEASGQIATLESDHQRALTTMQEELELEQEKGRMAMAKLAELQSQSGKIESDLVAKLRIELKNAEASLQSSQQRENNLAAANKDLSRQLTQAETSLAAATTPPADNPTASNPQTEQAIEAAVDLLPVTQTITEASSRQRQQAVELVTSWAKAWSAQNVQGYVSFYQSNYSSNSNLNHSDWVAQRRVRLTNKSFIQVNVRDFDVKASSDGFTVTFTQHYRSNTLDDTIRKRLSFTLPDDSNATPDRNWAAAKINGERIIRR